MKKIILILMMLCLLTGCGSSAPSTATTAAAETTKSAAESNNPYEVFEYNGIYLAYPKEWTVEEAETNKLYLHPGENIPMVLLTISDTDMEADNAHDYFIDYAVLEGQNYPDLEYEFEAAKDRILYKATYTHDGDHVYECMTVHNKHIFSAIYLNKEDIPEDMKQKISIILSGITD